MEATPAYRVGQSSVDRRPSVILTRRRPAAAPARTPAGARAALRERCATTTRSATTTTPSRRLRPPPAARPPLPPRPRPLERELRSRGPCAPQWQGRCRWLERKSLRSSSSADALAALDGEETTTASVTTTPRAGDNQRWMTAATAAAWRQRATRWRCRGRVRRTRTRRWRAMSAQDATAVAAAPLSRGRAPRCCARARVDDHDVRDDAAAAVAAAGSRRAALRCAAALLLRLRQPPPSLPRACTPRGGTAGWSFFFLPSVLRFFHAGPRRRQR
jgi:hypothetical protein